MGNGSDADAATEAVPASPIAHERGEELEEEKVTLDPGALAALITKLTAKVESLERSLETHQQQAAVTPPGTGAVFGQSVYRQALQHGGSLGMQRMQMHELGASNFGMGMQTPGVYGGLGAGQQPGGTPFQAQGAVPPPPQYPPQQQPAAQYQAHRPPPLHINERVPPAKDAKIYMRNFDGSEVYKGLGSGFEQWALLFIEQIEMAEQACGYTWSERYKVIKFGQHLRGKAEFFYQQHIMRWWAAQPTLWFVMEQMHMSFKRTLSTQQGMKLFGAKKDPSRSWNEHFLYLNALMMATNASPTLVLENIVKYADPELRHALMAKCDITRPDALQQANELAVWAQMMSDEDRAPKHIGKEVVNAVAETQQETRRCHKCKQVGHLKKNCPERLAGDGKNKAVRFALAASSGTSSVDANSWILDSGASRHLVNDPSLLANAVECSDEDICMLPDGRTMDVSKKGTVVLRAMVNGVATEVELSDVYYAPKLAQNLISYGRLMTKGCSLLKRNGKLALMKGDDVVFYVDVKHNVLVARLESVVANSTGMEELIMNVVDASTDAVSPAVTTDTLMGFHARFGHLALDTIERMAKDPASGIKISNRERKPCLVCAEGKQTRARQPTKDTGRHAPIDKVGGVICSDLKGPMTPLDRQGNRYMVNFVDHKSNYCRVFMAKKKNQAATKFEDFLVEFEKRFGCRVHVLRTDGGGEYRNVDLFCKENGVARQVSEVGNQAANGKAERMHRTILNMARCMVFGAELPLSFWGDAAEYAAYVLNRSSSRANEDRKSPFEVLTGQAPDLRDIVVFGSKCTVFRDPGKRAMKKRACEGVIIGKDESTKGYKVYLPSEKKVIVTRHVQNIRTLEEKPNGKTPTAQASTPTTQPAASTAPRRSRRARRKSRRRAEADGEVDVGESRLATESVALTVSEADDTNPHADDPEPKNFRQARKCAESALWAAAEQEELAALQANNTWKLVKCEPGAVRLHTKWVYKKKRTGTGAIERYKARLVACGNEQKFGVSFFLVCAAVITMTGVKFIFVIAFVWKVPARHGDVPNAYVKATMEEGVAILLFVPDGLIITEEELLALGAESVDEVGLLLGQSLYGLKQAGRLWHEHLHRVLVKIGFTQCVTDACLYFKADSGGMTVVGTYVDDLLVTGTDESRVSKFFDDMAVLELKDLGVASNFLGMRVQYDEHSGYKFDQEATIVEMLTKFGLEKANTVRAPIGGEAPAEADMAILLPLGTKELATTEPTVTSFQSLVGSLLWIARCTRPDIMFAVHCATRRTHAPTMADWKLAKRIARYLSGTRSHKLSMPGDDKARERPLRLCSYTDADFAADKDDRKSVSAAIVQVNGMTVSWQCKKQNSVALSTTEAEYVAATVGGQELLGLKELLSEMDIGVKLPMDMLMDNQAAIVQVQSETSSAKAKHVDVKLKFIQDFAKKGIVLPEYVASEEMLADLLTKALPAPRIKELREKIGLVDVE